MLDLLLIHPNDQKAVYGDTLKYLESSWEICPEWINFYITMPYLGSKDYWDAVNNGTIKNDKWIQYAQYSYECMPRGGSYLTQKEVLEFKDYAFNAFFRDNDRYFEFIRSIFGEQYVEKIKDMSKNKLRRKLLRD